MPEPSQPSPATPAVSPLDRQAEQVRRDLELLSYPERAWLPPRRTADGQPIYDVLIVGAGQGGLAAAFGLLRERITNILVAPAPG